MASCILSTDFHFLAPPAPASSQSPLSALPSAAARAIPALRRARLSRTSSRRRRASASGSARAWFPRRRRSAGQPWQHSPALHDTFLYLLSSLSGIQVRDRGRWNSCVSSPFPCLARNVKRCPVQGAMTCACRSIGHGSIWRSSSRRSDKRMMKHTQKLEITSIS